MNNYKTLIATTAITMAAFSTQSANAESSDSGGYLSLKGNASFLSDSNVDSSALGDIGNLEFKDGGGGSLALGYRFSDALRTELEFGANFNKAEGFANGANAYYDDNYMKAYYGMANFFIDFNNDSNWVPYIGAGIGYARVDIDDLDDDVLAYQGMAGVSITVADDVDLLLGYKYLATDDIELSSAAVGTLTTEYESHNLEFGLRFMF